MGQAAVLQPDPEGWVAAIDLIGVTQLAGTSASKARSNSTRASWGLVRKPTSSGTRAARHRAGSLVHERGRYSSRSMNARPVPLA